MDIKIFLHGLPAFERFSERHLDILQSCLQIQDFSDGGQLIVQGEQGKAMYILLSGAVTIGRRDPVTGTELEASEVREGEVFGVLSLVENLPAVETCIAHGHVTVAALTTERYHSLFLLAPPLANQLQYMLGVQLARELQTENKALRKGLAQKKSPSLLERLFGA